MSREPSEQVDRWASAVIGAAIEVHRILGPGYLEKTYEEALAVEFTLRGIPFSRQHPVALSYKGHPVGEGYLDFLIGGELVVELKTVSAFAEIHTAQVITYLRPPGVCSACSSTFMFRFSRTASSVSCTLKTESK